MDRLYDGIDHLTAWSERARNILRSFMGRLDGTCSKLVIGIDNQQFSIRLFSEKDSRDLTAIGLRSDHPLAVLLRNLERWHLPEPVVSHRVRRSEGRNARKPRFCIWLDGRTYPVYFYRPGCTSCI